MQTLIDLDTAPVFAIPARDGATTHEGVLVRTAGLGRVQPATRVPGPSARALADRGHRARHRRLARCPARTGAGRRHRVRDGSGTGYELVAASGCRTAAVEVADPAHALADDVARVAAVRDALGPDGIIRCDAKGRWSVDAAVAAIPALDRAAGGLEFVQQPCRSTAELAAVRRRVDVRIAIHESLEQSLGDPVLTQAADVAVLHCGSLGGARRALRIAESCGLPCTATSGVETSIGVAVGVALAGALPEFPFAGTLGSGSLLSADLVADSRRLVPVDGFLPVAPMSPAPLPELLERYTVTDPARIRWWRSRLESAIAQ